MSDVNILPPLVLPLGLSASDLAELVTNVLVRRAYTTDSPWAQWVVVAALDVLQKEQLVGQKEPLIRQKEVLVGENEPPIGLNEPPVEQKYLERDMTDSSHDHHHRSTQPDSEALVKEEDFCLSLQCKSNLDINRNIVPYKDVHRVDSGVHGNLHGVDSGACEKGNEGNNEDRNKRKEGDDEVVNVKIDRKGNHEDSNKRYEGNYDDWNKGGEKYEFGKGIKKGIDNKCRENQQQQSPLGIIKNKSLSPGSVSDFGLQVTPRLMGNTCTKWVQRGREAIYPSHCFSTYDFHSSPVYSGVSMTTDVNSDSSSGSASCYNPKPFISSSSSSLLFHGRPLVKSKVERAPLNIPLRAPTSDLKDPRLGRW
ncbi:hypothetical protein Pcinc_023900 [Petrolisthes cinctipes]|uniref:Uncharacterized protein n=1 Tax=Petrolisthes cinctipes TaxID=88211 RepID=A0AAE1F8I8_PETCI|nr:hypothetical protein Pcinc_025575 [Petrolisthes cinctipes]KAK3870929.1 hypothetical protein Pcinc_023900 [Petrolisthes cinctipes]